MKNVMNYFLVVVFVSISAGVQVCVGEDRYKYKSGGCEWTYTIDNGTATIISVSPRDGDSIPIPKKINGYPVRVIGERAFSRCDDITSLYIPEFISRIDGYAVSCDNLTNITISKNVKYIGEGAIKWCGKLMQVNVDPDNANYTTKNGVLLTKDQTVLVAGINGDVVIPDTVKRIGKEAFCGCKGLTSITIPDSVVEIGENAFYGCKGLTSITIPDSVVEIGEMAFFYCDALRSVTLGKGVIRLGAEAFAACEHLREIKVDKKNSAYASENGLLLSNDKKTLICGLNRNVIIPQTLNVIGSHAFHGCKGLKSINIPESVIEIGEDAFVNCDGLTDVVIPNSVTKICNEAFSWCDGLKKVTIGSGVRSIGEKAFYSCVNLTGITIPDSVTEIGKSAFGNCKRMTSVRIGNGLKVVPRYAFEECGLQKVEIPNSVTRVEGWAFVRCTNLVKVAIDKNATHVEDNAFNGCVKLGQDGFAIVGGKLGGYNGTSGNVVIPDEVTEIGAGAFGLRKDLTSVVIPNTVKKIGNRAFEYCSGLTSITIPDSVVEIGEKAFFDCDALRSVTLGKGVVRLGAEAFSLCENLLEFKVDKKNSTYASENGLLLSRDKSLLLCGCNGDVVIPKTVSSIGDHAFHCLVNLKSVEFPSSLNDIGEHAFEGCINLRAVTLPDSLTSIGDRAFDSCKGLTKVRIPNSVTSIGEGAFAYCGNLEDVTIGDGVENVEKDAFACSWNLKSISIPEAFALEIPSIFSNCPILDKVGRGDAWIDMRHDVKVTYREHYIDESAHGDPRAEYCLGMCYISGEGVVRDSLKGTKLLLQAARQGHAGAQYKVGWICFYQKDAKGYANAFDWWSSAAKQGHYQAIFSLKLIPADIRNGR